MAEINTKFKRAFFWIMGGQVVSQISSFVLGIYLASLLLPQHFGLVATSLIFRDILFVIISSGMQARIIYEKDISDDIINGHFYFTLLKGIFLAVTLYFSSGFISDYFGAPELKTVFFFSSFSLFALSVRIVPEALLNKNFDVKLASIFSAVFTIFSTVIGIYFAELGYEVFSLLIKLCLFELLMTVTILRLARMDFSARPNFKLAIKGSSYSRYVLFHELLSNISGRFDAYLIGYLFGQASLGLYSKSKELINKPLEAIRGAVKKPLMPLLSVYQDSPQALIEKFYLVLSCYTYMIYPILFGIVGISDVSVSLFLGSNWTPAIEYINAVSILVLVQTYTSLLGAIYLATGHSKLQFKVGLLFKPITIIGLFCSALLADPLVMIYGLSLTTFLNSLISLFFIKRFTNISIRKVASIVITNILYSFPILIIVYLLDPNSIVEMLFSIFASVSYFLLASVLLRPSGFVVILNELLKNDTIAKYFKK